MSEDRKLQLRIQPDFLQFGTVDIGSTLQGSFKVSDAQGFVGCSQRFCAEGACVSSPLPDWIELTQLQREDYWEVHIRTDRPGLLLANIVLEYANGTGSLHVSLEVTDSRPVLGDIVFWESPFNFFTEHHSLWSLVRVLGALPFRVHFVRSLTGIGEEGLKPRTVVLHGLGLIDCTDEAAELLRSLVANGTNLVVLADEFSIETTAAANRILSPFGLQMKRSGADDPSADAEERSRRRGDWQARYDQRPFDSGPSEICEHALTAGIRRVYWWRPCPVVCDCPDATPLVNDPTDASECFAAVARPGGYVVAVGQSLWDSLTSIGWPYDNDRLFANLLVGGDAEVIG